MSSPVLSPDEKFILFHHDGNLILRRLADNHDIWMTPYDSGMQEPVPSLYSPDGKYIVGREDHWSGSSVVFRSIHLWDAKSGKELYEFGNENLSLEDAYFLSNSKYLVTPGHA